MKVMPFLTIMRSSHLRQLAGRTQHRMQSVTDFTLEMTALHAVITIEVTDDRLDRLASLEQFLVLRTEALGLAPVHDVHLRVVCIHAAVAQIDKRGHGLEVTVLHQDRCPVVQLHAVRRHEQSGGVDSGWILARH